MQEHSRPIGLKTHHDGSDTESQRLWYGPTAVAILGSGFHHKAGFGHLLIPHPPVANWLLRWGVRQAEGRRLSLRHEIGHLQAAPVVLLYLGANLAAAHAAGNLNWRVGLPLATSAHAAWEILAETYVIADDRQFYHRCYQDTSKLPRLLFWKTNTHKWTRARR